jgi:hypothetical protein
MGIEPATKPEMGHESPPDAEKPLQSKKTTPMNKLISLVFLIGGIVLIAYGITASNSFSSSVSRTVNGAPTDRTIWLLVGGAVAAAVGLAGVLRGSKTP